MPKPKTTEIVLSRDEESSSSSGSECEEVPLDMIEPKPSTSRKRKQSPKGSATSKKSRKQTKITEWLEESDKDEPKILLKTPKEEDGKIINRRIIGKEIFV